MLRCAAHLKCSYCLFGLWAVHTARISCFAEESDIAKVSSSLHTGVGQKSARPLEKIPFFFLPWLIAPPPPLEAFLRWLTRLEICTPWCEKMLWERVASKLTFSAVFVRCAPALSRNCFCSTHLRHETQCACARVLFGEHS